jgi:lipopolysaccharide transport system ATP-binding protein
MRKREIDRKLGEIIDFSGVERYIDTPVKRYSSGMYVRLAFAVAAHLESEILIVDEVLAVGDAEFQKKCLGKMGEVSKGEGRTVLFVSHNMAAVQNLCNKGIFLEKGNIISFGSSKSILELYADSFRNIAKSSIWQAPVIYPELSAQILNVKVEVINNGLSLLVNTKFITNKRFKKSFLAFDVKSIDETPIFQTIPIEDSFIEYSHNELVNLTEIDLPKLIPGIYSLSVWIGPYYTETHDWQKDCVFFEIIENPNGDRIMPHYKENGYLITTSKIIT